MWHSTRARQNNALEYLRTLSFARLLNVTRLLAGYLASRVTRKPMMWGAPFTLSTEPSGHCQLSCPECPTGAGTLTRPKGLMTLEIFQQVLEQSAPQLMYLNLFFQGEPLLNKKVAGMARLARQRKIYTTLSTNGLLLDTAMCEALVTAGVSRMIISLDGITQGTYEKYRRGGQVAEVKSGIQRLLATRKKMGSRHPLVVVQVLAFEHNQSELPAIKQWCLRQGVDKLEVKSAQIYGLTVNETKPPQAAKLSRYKQGSRGQLQFKRPMYNHCWRQWSSAVIAWDATLAPCCYDKDLNYSPGNLKTQSLKTLWQGPTLTSFRRQILKDKSQIEICNNCPEGRKFLL